MLHQIGSGVLGPVFRTYDAERDRLVAVKAFRLDIVPEQVAELAEALRRAVSGHVTHPSIVTPIEAGLEGSTAFLASEYIAAETLDVALRHLAPAPLATSLPLLRRMADAIDAAWQAGPAQGHGALHPRDVFVSQGPVDVRIGGFGVVPALESVGIKAPVRRPYTAPERSASGADKWDARADVFSLGAIAHELLTGRRPAGPGEQDGALPGSIRPEVRVKIRRVLSSALAERPEQRFASARAFIDALEAAGTNDALPLLPFETAEDTSSHAASDAAAASAPAADTPVQESSAAGVESPFADIDLDPAVPLTVDPGLLALDKEGPLSVAPPLGAEAEPVRSARKAPRSRATRPVPVAVPADAPLEEIEKSEAIAERPAESVASAVDDLPSRLTDEMRPEPPVARAPIEPPVTRPIESPASFSASAPASSMLSSYGPVDPSARAPYPLAAFAVVFVAGVLVGGVGLSMFGRAPVATPPAPVTQSLAPAPAPPKPDEKVPPGTDVVVPPTAAAPAAEPKAAKPPAGVTTGRVIVKSTPTGATVLLDGKMRGHTPLTVRDLAFGTHALVVSRAGFANETRDIALTPDRPAGDVLVELKAARAPAAVPPPKSALKTGSLDVSTRPGGATVFLDGRSIGVTPMHVPDATVGSHTIRVELRGYKSISTTVDVAAGQTARFTVTLEQTTGATTRRD